MVRGRPPVDMFCPDCKSKMIKSYNGWLCPSEPEECSLIRVKGHCRWGATGRVTREARPRPRPLSVEELRNLMEPYLTPSVERLLNEATAPGESIPA